MVIFFLVSDRVNEDLESFVTFYSTLLYNKRNTKLTQIKLFILKVKQNNHI